MKRALGVTAGLLLGAGIVFVPVASRHAGARSVEEARLAAEIVAGLVGCTWTDVGGVEREITREDILLVAPYNLQVAEMERAASLIGQAMLRP